MTKSYNRPNIPYTEGEKRPNNNRYKILTDAKKPLTPNHLDGEMNYIIDSLNAVSNDANKAASGLVIGSDKIENKNKLLTTDGDEKSPTLSWIKVDSELIQEKAIKSEHILEQEVIRSKIANKAIDNSKIAEEAVTVDNIKFLYKTEVELHQNKRAWAKGVGETNNVRETIVVRDKKGVINAGKIVVDEIESSTIAILEKKIEERIAKGLQQSIDEAFMQEHPVGSYNFNNPRDGQEINGHKIAWELVKGGKVLVTSDNTEAKEIDTEQNIRDKTAGHALSLDELPSHTHDVNVWDDRTGGAKDPFVVTGTRCSRGLAGKALGDKSVQPTGGNQSHSHKLDLTRIELPLYKRIS